MSAQIIDFKARAKKASPPRIERITDALNGIKIKLIDYFKVEEIKTIHIVPADLKCAYETHLLHLCQLLQEARTPEAVQDVAEYIFTMDVKNLSLQGFIEIVNKDDLILGCLQTELSRLSALDKLFLVNVLRTKFPADNTTTSFMKTLLFAKDQSRKIDPDSTTPLPTRQES